jgi:hypothetical protein
MHESREKRSLSLLRSGRVRRRLLLLGGPSQSVRAHRSCIPHQHVSQPFIHDTPTQFTAVSKTVKRVELGGGRIIRIQIHETTVQTLSDMPHEACVM